jgi:PAP_fibrillin
MHWTVWTSSLALPTVVCLSLVDTRHKSCTAGYWSASRRRQLPKPTSLCEQRIGTLWASRSGRSSTETSTASVEELRDELLALVRDAPTGRATPPSLTARILDRVRMLEQGSNLSPTNDASSLLPSALAGTWELLWTAQDPLAPESQRLWSSWINPLENQSYSNNPQAGQANPFLPLALQTRLQQLGILDATSTSSSSSLAPPLPPPVRSTQSIDVKSGLIRNVVAVNLGKRTAALTVTIRFATDATDVRRVNVKFESCRVVVPQTPIDWDVRFGILGPTGWLRTVYIDDGVRITRGHKGSVFILSRPGRT